MKINYIATKLNFFCIEIEVENLMANLYLRFSVSVNRLCTGTITLPLPLQVNQSLKALESTMITTQYMPLMEPLLQTLLDFVGCLNRQEGLILTPYLCRRYLLLTMHGLVIPNTPTATISTAHDDADVGDSRALEKY